MARPSQRVTGKYIRCSEKYDPFRAFVPYPLPPNPPIVLDDEICDLMEKANLALGRLDGVTALLPDTYLFTYFYVRKEALLSSQIEGTQSSLQELLLFELEEAPGAPIDEVIEVSHYARAMHYGLQSIRGDGRLPLSLRLLCEMHGILLERGRGGSRTPGEFRVAQNWVGGSRPSNAVYVPPPYEQMQECLYAFEKYLHDQPTRTPALIKAALSHVQFETIHPFQDGNGRLGRLLITLLLCSEGVLKEPMLYLSLYFKTNRDEYYARLQSVRDDGDWEGWLRFFLQGVLETSRLAYEAALSILALFDKDKRRIATLGQRARSILIVYETLQSRPIVSVPTAIRMLRSRGVSMSDPTIYACFKELERLNIVGEVTRLERNRLYVYNDYMTILAEGTNPIKL